jgi:hypothetical protein
VIFHIFGLVQSKTLAQTAAVLSHTDEAHWLIRPKFKTLSSTIGTATLAQGRQNINSGRHRIFKAISEVKKDGSYIWVSTEQITHSSCSCAASMKPCLLGPQK